jgi:hypothetical protein
MPGSRLWLDDPWAHTLAPSSIDRNNITILMDHTLTPVWSKIGIVLKVSRRKKAIFVTVCEPLNNCLSPGRPNGKIKPDTHRALFP